MLHRWLPLLALLAAAPAAAQVAPPRTLPLPPAQDTTLRTIRLGLTQLPPPVPLDVRLPSIDGYFMPIGFRDFVDTWSRSLRDRLIDDGTTLALRDRLDRAADRVPLADPAAQAEPPTDSVPYLPPLVDPDTAVVTDDALTSIVGDYADIGMRVTGRGELGGAWTRYSPCDPSLLLNCNPSLFPQLEPNVEFGVQVGGTISDRIHVNVDYDQRREDFSASNNINVFYQGFADEVLQRVEVGDVSIRLPASRYLTRGIPAGNFGLMASGQLGPIDFQTVWAQQRGDVSTSEFRLASGGQGEGLVQDDRIVLDDADYVEGQFFFLVDPALVSGAPHVDVLALVATDAPAAVRPAQGGTIQLYRDERSALAGGEQQAQLGLFLANATSDDGTLTHAGQFRRLVPDEDYLVHSSGLWIMLRSPLRSDEALAMAYVTESGETVGTLNAEGAPAGTTPELRLLRSPIASHQPGRPTWDYEMHQVYRLNASSQVELESVELVVSLGDAAGGRTFRDVGGRQVTFLRLFGLDEDAPTDALDVAQIWQPNRESLSVASGARIGGTFVVFPTLQPFLDPPPVPSADLTAEEARAVLAGDANATIYTNADPVIRDGGARFRLNFGYRVRVEGLVTSFNLGQFGIREGSERLTFAGRPLERGVDYTIDYEIGQVTLSDAPSLFGTNPAGDLRATWEQKSLFQIAPTSVFGMNARYRLGQQSELNFVGLYQSEKTLYSRPQLGVEPGAAFLGGASARLDLGGQWLDRVLDRVPGLRLAAPTAVTLDGELAFSLPNPNRRGAAYLDDFEGTDEVAVDVRRQQWKLGARPGTTDGDDGALPSPMTAANAASLVWQHDISTDGTVTGNLRPQQIDNQINIAGNQLAEPVMWLTFGDVSPAGETVWRSMTTVLSTTGRDMTRSEYVELYVDADADAPLSLVLDIGTAGEDAFYVDAEGNTNGTYPDGVPWGLGVLDEEASVSRREVWGPLQDARGLWDQPCDADPLTAYPRGDPRSNCTRGNGVNDTEDLDGNGILDADDGAYFRYVIRLDRVSQYLVRDTDATGTGFRLYRIPLRTGAGAAVNGANEGTWRFIKHLRLTLAGEPAGVTHLTIARMRIVGSRWTKRDIHGVVRGLVSDEPGIGAASTRLRAGPVSRLTDGNVYEPPPGVLEQVQDPTSQFGVGGVEFNEKSQRIAYEGLEPGDRVEIYLRYPQSPQNFLSYRQLRLWAVPRAGEWGPGGSERLLVKLGTDPRNHYLFQTRLRPATGERPVTAADWTPELAIDVGQWLALKAEAEEALIRQGAFTEPVVLWSADSTYGVVLEDRARAPNLAAVRELAFAVYNDGPAATDGEVWIDDIRLVEPDRDPGLAGNIDLQITGDFFSATIGYANRGARFRQFDEDATYQGQGDFTVATRAQLDRFMPERWGFDVPLTVTHTSSSQDPLFLERSDVRAEHLDGLRDTGAGLTRVGLRISRITPMSNPWLGAVVDGLSMRVGWNTANTQSITARSEASGIDGGIDWRLEPGRHDLSAVPGFLEAFLRALAPGAIERTDAFQRLVGARLRYTPSAVGFGTSYFDQEARAFRFDRILEDTLDARIAPVESPRQGLENTAQIAFEPFVALTAAVTVRSSRDLLDPDRATNRVLEREALREARASVAGSDVGWETNRTMMSTVSFRPEIANWIRPSYTYSNRYATDRSPSYLEIVRSPEDSTAELQRRFGSDRQLTRRLDLQPGSFVQDVFGATIDSAGGVSRVLYRLGSALQTVSLAWNSGVNSQFERAGFKPGLGYQFGFGGIESFRAIGDDSAAVALARDDVRLSSGIAVPFDGLLSLTYTEATMEGFDARGGSRTQDQTGWPNVRLSWRQIPIPEVIQGVVSAVSIGGGYERVIRSTTYGFFESQRRGAEEHRYPLELSVTLGQSLTTSYTGTIVDGTSTDPTGDAEQDRVNHSLRMSGSFQPPGFLGDKFQSPFQMSLILSDDTQRHCRHTAAGSTLGGGCVPFVDTSTRSANLTLDTILSDLTVGLRLSYTARDNHVGTRAGSNQFQLGLFGQFNFTAGRMDAIGGAGVGVR